jgi:hypothetical protein
MDNCSIIDVVEYFHVRTNEQTPSMAQEHENARHLWVEKLVDNGVRNWNEIKFSDEKSGI